MSPPSELEAVWPAVTGLGVVSAIGAGIETFWQAVLDGKNGAAPVRAFDTKDLRNHVGCEVDEEHLANTADPNLEELPRASRLAAIAASEALDRAGLSATEIDLFCIGTTMGDLPEVEPLLESSTIADHAERIHHTVEKNFAVRIAYHLGIEAPAWTVATACSAGNIAICRAIDMMRSGRVRRALVGGADAFSKLAFIGFSRMRAMAPDFCKAFAQDRKGMLVGEGAGFLVLESAHEARRRGVPVYGVLRGYGLSCDAHHVATPPPDGHGAVSAMRRALRTAGLQPEDVDYVSAHGTGTLRNDRSEAQACHTVFGEHRPFVSSLKSLTGHTMGAASAIEAVASLLSLRDHHCIPAWNVRQPAEDCDVRLPLPDVAGAPPRLDTILSNAFAFGGNNSCLVLQRAP